VLIDPDRCCLGCPVCGAPLGAEGGSARCAAGHSFDFARSGYLNLTHSGGTGRVGDSAAMVRARAAFLAAGHYEPLAAALAEAAVAAAGAGDAGDDAGGGAEAGVLCELGCGTGYHLAAVARALAAAERPPVATVGIDLAKAAADRAAKDHPEAAFVVADIEEGVPLLDASVALCLSVFAPRPAAELGRVICPGGTLLVALAAPSHLAHLRERAGLIAVGEDKPARLGERLAPWFEPAATSALEFPLRLSEEDARNLVLMGPSARHDPDLSALAGGIEDRASVTLASYRRRPEQRVH
jgi:23S rRNA (guanine745-N1)-methyltransferase